MDLARAVSATISYADYFNFPLFAEEIHYWLICPRFVSKNALKPYLREKISVANRRYRLQTAKFSEQKILHAQKLASLLKYFPGLRLVALTGSVAAENSKKDDDIDLFFITAPHTLWLVRPLVIGLIAIFFRRRHPLEDPAHAPNAFCPNLWLDTLSLTIANPRRSLYTAHEVLQTVPLLDRGDTYQSFLKANSWTKKYLANAYTSLTSQNLSLPSPDIRHLRSENLSFLLAPLNLVFFLFQFIYMLPKKTTETVNLHAAHLHTTDYSAKLRHIIT